MCALDGTEELQTVGRALPNLNKKAKDDPYVVKPLMAHPGYTYLDSFIAAPGGKQSVFLMRSAGSAVVCRGQEHHAVYISVVCRVEDVLRRNVELGVGGGGACEDGMAVTVVYPPAKGVVDAIPGI